MVTSAMISTGMLLMGIMLAEASRRRLLRVAPQLLGERCTDPLPDIVHQHTPVAPLWAPEVMLIVSTVMAVSEVTWSEMHREARRLGLSFAMRAVTTQVTVIPTPVPTGSYCFGWDLFVSGHTLLFASASAVLQQMWPLVIGGAMLVVSRQHYTIDVVGGIMVYQCASAVAV